MAESYLWQTPARCMGVNNTEPDFMINDAELSACDNYEPDLTGQGWLTKRAGLTKTDTTERTAQSYSIYQGRNGNYYHNGTVVYNFAGTSVDTGQTAASDTWTSFATYDIRANGTEVRKSSNGTSFSALSNVPAGTKYICSHNNFLFAAGHAAGKLRWSSVGTAETWPAVNEYVLTNDENDDVVSLLKIPSALMVLAEKSFYLVTGTTDLDMQIVYSSTKDGCASTLSAVNTPYGAFWWTRAGICWLKNGYELDYPMQRKLAKTLNGLNRAYDSSVHAVWNSYRGCVHFWLFNGAAQTTCNLRVDFYPYYDAFFLHSGAGVNMACSGVAIISGVENIYVSGYASSTYLYKQSGTTDSGTTIASSLDTKREGNPMTERQIRSVVLTTDLTTAGTVSIASYPNHATAASVSTDTAPGTGAVDTYIATNLQNTRLKHKVYDSLTTGTRIVQITHFGSMSKTR